ncbi:MAG: hypothetical protein KA714_20460 [Limnoraphis sp. WC205]|jgi:hypothetical protein|nr:hypothetical protein [Limnoraphis sp. WC205]
MKNQFPGFPSRLSRVSYGEAFYFFETIGTIVQKTANYDEFDSRTAKPTEQRSRKSSVIDRNGSGWFIALLKQIIPNLPTQKTFHTPLKNLPVAV